MCKTTWDFGKVIFLMSDESRKTVKVECFLQEIGI